MHDLDFDHLKGYMRNVNILIERSYTISYFDGNVNNIPIFALSKMFVDYMCTMLTLTSRMGQGEMLACQWKVH